MPLVADGMRVGLGTGSTARWFILGLAERVRQGLRVRAVATSLASAALATQHGMPVEELGADGLDIAVDGADCVDPALRLIKGRGGAMVREKIVAESASRFVVVVDDGKCAPILRGCVPVEIVRFGSARTLQVLSAETSLRFAIRADEAGTPVTTDNGNLIADSEDAEFDDPAALAEAIAHIPGVAGHGLFLGLSDLVLVGHADGTVERLTSHPAPTGDTVGMGG